MPKRTQENWFQPRGNSKFSSVVFVPSTPGSSLMKSVPVLEEQNNQGRKNRIKFVEKAGRTVRNVVARNYPWSFEKCNSEECFQCTTCSSPKISCRKPGIAYIITCNICRLNGVNAEYQGETSKSAFTRGKKHLDEFKAYLKTNCMVIHNITHHQSSKTLNFEMTVVKAVRGPMDRQIDESIRIKDSTAHIIMNSGSEWRGDAVPRASFQAPGLPLSRRNL